MPFSVELFLLMISYGLLNGTGAILVRIGFKKTERKGINLAQGRIFHQIKLAGLEFFQMIRIKEWLLGVSFILIAFLLLQIGLQNFNLLDVRPLSNINLVFIIILSKIVLKETFKTKELIGIIVSFGSLILISISAQESTNIVNVDNFYIAIFCVVAITGVVLLFLYKFKLKYEYMIGMLNGCFFTIGTIANKALLTEISVAGNNFGIIFESQFLYLFLGAYAFGAFTTLVFLSAVKARVSVMTLISEVGTLVLLVGFSSIVFAENLLYLPNGIFTLPISLFKIFGIVLAILGLILLYSPTSSTTLSTENPS